MASARVACEDTLKYEARCLARAREDESSRWAASARVSSSEDTLSTEAAAAISC